MPASFPEARMAFEPAKLPLPRRKGAGDAAHQVGSGGRHMSRHASRHQRTHTHVSVHAKRHDFLLAKSLALRAPECDGVGTGSPSPGGG